MTRSQREAVILRNLPLNDAQAAHLLSNAEHARQCIASLQARGLVELVGDQWRRRDVVRVVRRADAVR